MENENQNLNTEFELPPDYGKGFSVAALVLGIIGIIGAFMPFIISIFTTVCAILGLIFGVIGRKKSKNTLGRASGLATAGMILGIIGTSFAAIGIICTLACAAWLVSL